MIRQAREEQMQQKEEHNKSMAGLREKYSHLLLQVKKSANLVTVHIKQFILNYFKSVIYVLLNPQIEEYHGQLASTWEEMYPQVMNTMEPLQE